MSATKYYAVVCFGSPAVRVPSVCRTLEAAKRAAAKARGTGTCTTARVIECDTLALARTADIGRTRAGERTVHSA